MLSFYWIPRTQTERTWRVRRRYANAFNCKLRATSRNTRVTRGADQVPSVKDHKICKVACTATSTLLVGSQLLDGTRCECLLAAFAFGLVLPSIQTEFWCFGQFIPRFGAFGLVLSSIQTGGVWSIQTETALPGPDPGGDPACSVAAIQRALLRSQRTPTLCSV